MSPAVLIIVYTLMLVGIAGSILPVIPGALLILIGAFLHALVSNFDPIDPWRLALLLVLTLLAYALDYLAGVLGTKRLGGSRWAMVGALAGGIAGLFFGPIGILIGPILGAMAAEWLYRKDVQVALKSGVGAVVGVFVGAVAKLGLAVVMVGLFTYWILQG